MATTGVFNGRDIGLYYNNTLIAYARSHSLSLKAATMDITTKDSILWADFLPTVKDWSITIDGLVALDSSWNADLLGDALIAGTKIVAKFKTNVSGDKYWKGEAYITSFDLSAGMDEPFSFSCTLTGTGVLSSVTMT